MFCITSWSAWRSSPWSEEEQAENDLRKAARSQNPRFRGNPYRQCAKAQVYLLFLAKTAMHREPTFGPNASPGGLLR